MKANRFAVIDHARQTRYSDPGRWASLLDTVEPTIESVGRMSRNVIAHYRAQADQLPESTQGDVNLRWTDAMLDIDQARHQAPLTAERKLGERLRGLLPRSHSTRRICVATSRHPCKELRGFRAVLVTDMERRPRDRGGVARRGDGGGSIRSSGSHSGS